MAIGNNSSPAVTLAPALDFTSGSGGLRSIGTGTSAAGFESFEGMFPSPAIKLCHKGNVSPEETLEYELYCLSRVYKTVLNGGMVPGGCIDR